MNLIKQKAEQSIENIDKQTLNLKLRDSFLGFMKILIKYCTSYFFLKKGLNGAFFLFYKNNGNSRLV